MTNFDSVSSNFNNAYRYFPDYNAFYLVNRSGLVFSNNFTGVVRLFICEIDAVS